MSQRALNKENSNNQRSLERLFSRRASQIGSSFSCQFCVLGFLSGVSLTSLFLAALLSFSSGISFSASSNGFPTSNSSSGEKLFVKPKDIQRITKLQTIVDNDNNKMNTNVSYLFSAWSNLLNKSKYDEQNELLLRAPHIENCKLSSELNKRLDTRAANDIFPAWTMWKGDLDTYLLSTTDTDEQLKRYRNRIISEGAYPPWITGSDEENYPLTRKVQRDIWLNQHPMNCSDPDVRFLVADWDSLPRLGFGAQIVGMSGLLAIAINEKRVLVTKYYNRADHEECQGMARSSWSCYFFPETSQECKERAFQLMKEKSAWEKGIITQKRNYNPKTIWVGEAPRVWGEPWSYLQPTTYIDGKLVAYHRNMDRRWWRAQAIRYLMRFQTEYTCSLLNTARHEAFGREAAKLVLATPVQDKDREKPRTSSELENFVWSGHKAWIPRPILSLHVRMGDKASEMKVVEFEDYMSLAQHIRKRFTHLNGVWLSTEMQEVIEKTKSYPDWNFYYTKVKRQVGNTTMATYEASLGRKTSTNYPLINFLMASEADFFVGALGSTWCFLIDGMRNTGGKVMSGYLSVNRDRFW